MMGWIERAQLTFSNGAGLVLESCNPLISGHFPVALAELEYEGGL
jgi:hypothetical protein